MITVDELLDGTPWTDLTDDVKSNIYRLHYAMNVIRIFWKRPMIVTSAFRTFFKHRQIYTELNASRAKRKLKPLDPPEHSMHLIGAACDISDPKGDLHLWCVENETLLEHLGLYCEEIDEIPRVHFQCYPPASGKRFFKP